MKKWVTAERLAEALYATSPEGDRVTWPEVAEDARLGYLEMAGDVLAYLTDRR